MRRELNGRDAISVERQARCAKANGGLAWAVRRPPILTFACPGAQRA
jgi:hypothetical protein